MLDGTAQLVLGLEQGDLVAPVAQLHGGLHAGGAAADDGHLHGGQGLGLQNVQTVLDADLGVDRADGNEGIVGAAAVALVAPQAGDQILVTALLEELTVLGVGDKGAGGGDDVQGAVGHSLLHVVEIVEAAHAGDLHLQALFTGVFGVLQEGGALQLEGDGVVGVGHAGAELDDVHIGLGHFQELHALVHAVAPLGFLAGEQHLHDHVPAGGLADGLQTLEGELGPVFQAAAELVGALVGLGGEELGGQLAAVAQVDGHHVKAQEFEDAHLLGVAPGDEVHLLPGHGHDGGHHGAVVLVRLLSGVAGGRGRGSDVPYPQDLQTAVLFLQGVAGGGAHKEAHTGDGAVVVDQISQLHQVVLAGGVVQIIVGEVGEVGLHGDFHAPGKVVDAHAGDDGGTRLGLIGIMGEDRVDGMALGTLQEMGQGVGDLQTVLQHLSPDDQGREHMGIFYAHISFLLRME